MSNLVPFGNLQGGTIPLEGCDVMSGWAVNWLLREGRHALLLTAMIGANMFLEGCGGSSKKVTPVDIQISPAATAIPVNSSVDLQASEYTIPGLIKALTEFAKKHPVSR